MICESCRRVLKSKDMQIARLRDQVESSEAKLKQQDRIAELEKESSDCYDMFVQAQAVVRRYRDTEIVLLDKLRAEAAHHRNTIAEMQAEQAQRTITDTAKITALEQTARERFDVVVKQQGELFQARSTITKLNNVIVQRNHTIEQLKENAAKCKEYVPAYRQLGSTETLKPDDEFYNLDHWTPTDRAGTVTGSLYVYRRKLNEVAG